MPSRVSALIAVACLVGCYQASTQPVPTPASTPRLYALPTATEIFNLRSKCAELADKILENNFIGSALTQNVNSHYNPATNRCYVELNVNAADLSQWDKLSRSRYLFDGQTKEMLLTTKVDKGIQSGSDFMDGKAADFNAVSTKIDAFMSDDRKQ